MVVEYKKREGGEKKEMIRRIEMEQLIDWFFRGQREGAREREESKLIHMLN